jgi:hypothetical protein
VTPRGRTGCNSRVSLRSIARIKPGSFEREAENGASRTRAEVTHNDKPRDPRRGVCRCITPPSNANRSRFPPRQSSAPPDVPRPEVPVHFRTYRDVPVQTCTRGMCLAGCACPKSCLANVPVQNCKARYACSNVHSRDMPDALGCACPILSTPEMCLRCACPKLQCEIRLFKRALAGYA